MLASFRDRFGLAWVLTLSGGALIGATGQSSAQEKVFVWGLSNKTVKSFVDVMRENIHVLKLSDGSHVPAETEEELKHPIIPAEEAKEIVDVGFASAYAEWCGVDWQHLSFLPLMAYQRSRHKWSDKQLAFIGGLHGYTLGVISEINKDKGPCPPEEKFKVEGYLAQRW
tara:strand:+ start:116 stop:622 length:507 start_codon:yes stop_codon:yes gene_type:complete